MSKLLRLSFLAAIAAGVVWLSYGPKSGAPSSRDAIAFQPAQDAEDLDVATLTDELKRTGQVVRRKTESAALKLGEATADARTTAAIKGKLALESGLSALDIGVDTADGRVTLSGRVESPDQLARAIRLALDENNVREVVSTLQVVEVEKQAKQGR
jgi:hypothetical protein